MEACDLKLLKRVNFLFFLFQNNVKYDIILLLNVEKERVEWV